LGIVDVNRLQKPSLHLRNKAKKIVRFVRIYSVMRVIAKIAGRYRPNLKLWLLFKAPLFRTNGKRVAIIGCGHHAYSSIAYFLTRYSDSTVFYVADKNVEAARSLAYAYALNPEMSMLTSSLNKCELAFIASNHASHADYAVDCLNLGMDVFIEKPICTSAKQLKKLSEAVYNSGGCVFSGFNRPYSDAIQSLRERVVVDENPFSLNCSIVGHALPNDHWYRNEDEGSRVLSNLCHWLDLSIHFLVSFKIKKFEFLDIELFLSDHDTPSENMVINIKSSNQDLISIFFTTRSEPFEGVSEFILFQKGDLIMKIDDFRSTKFWKNENFEEITYHQKDNGHKACVMQPFLEESDRHFRSWEETVLSARLALTVDQMARRGDLHRRVTLTE
jgi:predicted dehydrogenase